MSHGRRTVTTTVTTVLGNEGSLAPPDGRVSDVMMSITNETSRRVEFELTSDTVTRVLGTVDAHATKNFSLPGGLGAPGQLLRFHARSAKAVSTFDVGDDQVAG